MFDDGVLDPQQRVDSQNRLGITGRKLAHAAVAKGVEQRDGLRVVGRRIRGQLIVPERQAFVEGGAIGTRGRAVNAVERRRVVVLNRPDSSCCGGDVGAVIVLGIAYVQLAPHAMGVDEQLNGRECQEGQDDRRTRCSAQFGVILERLQRIARCPQRKEAQQESRARIETVGHTHAAPDVLERA